MAVLLFIELYHYLIDEPVRLNLFCENVSLEGRLRQPVTACAREDDASSGWQIDPVSNGHVSRRSL